MSHRAEEVANAVLYEGYILYPYRPSSVKNQQRWNFGVVYPPGSSEGAATMQTQCLAVVSSGGAPAGLQETEVDLKVRFLHLLSRTTVELDEPVMELADGEEPKTYVASRNEAQPWQEGVEREVLLAGCSVTELLTRPMYLEFTCPAKRETEPRRDEQGRIAQLIVREHQFVSGAVEVSAERIDAGLVRLTAKLTNLTRCDGERTRDGVLLQSLVSAHKILSVRGGEFVSLIDPPESFRQAAGECKNVGTWPVLAGEEGQRDAMLSSPIILYDYPQIAPESAGDLCDGTEIDEILSLRILTLTDEEKREMRESDERGRRILERTEALQEEQWLKLHGILRGLRPAPEVIR
jgi:hydrogenase maturation protease